MARPLLALAAAILFLGAFLNAPSAHADVCPYPGVGMGANVLVGRGWFCDLPQEINGSHLHCEAGSVGLGGAALFGGDNGSIGLGGGGVGGWSCTWRCPDGVMAPPPNPPGAWRSYMVPMNTTNFCKDHSTPNGFWSAPVLPTEGIPPAGEPAPAPGQEILPPQPIPPPLPTQPAPPPPPASALVPGEPGALTPGEPNP